MRIAVVGGGINGVCCAREAALAGHRVTLFEKSSLLAATSANSSRLLHGGLRYLEQGAVAMVKQSLNARHRWLNECPEHTERIALNLPVYRSNRLSRASYAAAFSVYHLLGLGKNLGRFSYLGAAQFHQQNAGLKPHNLLGGFRFYDGYMDDRKLGAWVIDRAMAAGVTFKEYRPVSAISTTGALTAAGVDYNFDHIYCCAGPWVKELAKNNQIPSQVELDYVRGSHIIIARKAAQHYMLEVPNSSRFFFILPHEKGSMIGTTERHQPTPEPVITSTHEIDELITNYNHYVTQPINATDIIETRAGVRPLIKGADTRFSSSREAKIETIDKLTLVWGGKWTSAPHLAAEVAKSTLQ